MSQVAATSIAPAPRRAFRQSITTGRAARGSRCLGAGPGARTHRRPGAPAPRRWPLRKAGCDANVGSQSGASIVCSRRWTLPASEHATDHPGMAPKILEHRRAVHAVHHHVDAADVVDRRNRVAALAQETHRSGFLLGGLEGAARHLAVASVTAQHPAIAEVVDVGVAARGQLRPERQIEPPHIACVAHRARECSRRGLWVMLLSGLKLPLVTSATSPSKPPSPSLTPELATARRLLAARGGWSPRTCCPPRAC